jgi:tRNA 2-thiouridine synthesizing protein A
MDAQPTHKRQSVNQPESPENTGSEALPEATLLDVRGLKCPMPLLKAKKALNGLEPGGLLRVIATDPGSERDFETFSAQSGHALLEFEHRADEYVYLLRKKDA